MDYLIDSIQENHSLTMIPHYFMGEEEMVLSFVWSAFNILRYFNILNCLVLYLVLVKNHLNLMSESLINIKRQRTKI